MLSARPAKCSKECPHSCSITPSSYSSISTSSLPRIYISLPPATWLVPISPIALSPSVGRLSVLQKIGSGSNLNFGSILDTIYKGMQRILRIDPKFKFEPLPIFWSTDNRPTDGDKAIGEIGTSHVAGGKEMYILGKEDVDIDEYDEGVM